MKTDTAKNTAAEAVKEEVVEQETGLSVPAPGSVGPAIDFSEDADSGFETVGARDMSVPFFAVLQKTSPQVDEASDKFIPGSKPGMVMNTVTHELFDGKEGITVIPCGFKKALVEWKDRDSGGGLVGQRSENDPILKKCVRNAKNQLETPDGTIIIDTAYHFVIHLRSDGNYDWGILGLSSTQLKASRNWILAMRSLKLQKADGSKYTPAMFSHLWKLTTVGQSKDKYNWWGWNIENVGQIKDPTIYSAARDFAKLISDGLIQATAPPSEFDSPDGGTEKADVPF